LRRLRVFLTVVMCSLGLHQMSSAQSADCNTAGTVSRETYDNQVSFRERYYTVYLPPCYDSQTESYPLLMLLHGSNAADDQWVRLGFTEVLDAKIVAGEVQPFIVVMPFGENIANENRFDEVTYDNILLDFLQQMNERYRTNGKQAIGGISRGGFWAYHIGLRFPEQFVAIGGHSPFFDVYHAPPEYNPLNLAEQLPSDTHLKLWLDRGTSDYAAEGVDRMHVNLDAAKVPHEYLLYPGGGHDEPSWREHIDDYVNFYVSAFASIDDAPEETATPTGYELWIPAGGFPTLNTSITSEELAGLLNGELNERLVLSQSSFDYLTAKGFVFHPDTFVTADDTLDFHLWQDKNLFTLIPFDALTLRFRPLWVDDVPVVDQLDTYPLVWESDTPNYSASRLTRITLSGTTAVARNMIPAIDKIGIEAATSGIRDYVLLSDFFQVTNEASIAPTCPQYTSEVLGGNNSLCMKPEHADLFRLLDVDVVDLTGNHINDFGYEVLSNTLDYFRGLGIQLVGGGQTKAAGREPLILEHNGSRIGWIACNHVGPYYAMANEDENALGGVRPGTVECDVDWLREALPLLSAEVDVVLVTMQYQEFEEFLPTEQQRIDYQTVADWGADIVIGTAEHKPMTFEFYPTRRGEQAFIHYGLGNLFFDQPFWGNMRFFLDTLYIYDGQLLTVELFPGIIDDFARPRLLEGEEQFNFLHYMLIQQNGF
jgi:enterochelin esterase-like enzyme